jgi:hypothetical protein
MKITIHTKVGSFTSKELSEEHRETVQKAVRGFSQGLLTHFAMEGENKEFFFPAEVLKQSVFVIQD